MAKRDKKKKYNALIDTTITSTSILAEPSWMTTTPDLSVSTLDPSPSEVQPTTIVVSGSNPANQGTYTPPPPPPLTQAEKDAATAAKDAAQGGQSTGQAPQGIDDDINKSGNVPGQDQSQPAEGGNANLTPSAGSVDDTDAWWDIGDEGFGWEEGVAIGLPIVAGLAIDRAARKKESLIGRIFNAANDLHNQVWIQYEGMFTGANEETKSVQKDLLRRDFAREGPLYRAWKANDLAMNPSRTGWLPFGMEYNERNFNPRTNKDTSKNNYGGGFVQAKKRDDAFFYDSDSDRVFKETELKAKLASGEFYGMKQSTVRGKPTVSVLDVDGKPRTFTLYKRTEKIPTLGITAEEARLGITKTSSTVSADEEPDVAEAKREEARMKARLDRLRNEKVRIDTTDPAVEAEKVARMKLLQEQRDADAKRRREEAAEASRLKLIEETRQTKDKIERSSAALSQPIADELVDNFRFKQDKEWVMKWVASGLGGLIPSDAIKNASYVRGPPDELLITWTDDYANERGIPANISTTERFKRTDLINAEAIPPKYGPSRIPLFVGGPPSWTGGRIPRPMTNVMPKTRDTTTNSSRMSALFARKKLDARVSGQARVIDGKRFRIMPSFPRHAANISAKYAQKGLSATQIRNAGVNQYLQTRRQAQSEALAHRRLGRLARVIPLRNNKFGVYVGPSRKR